MRNFSEKFVERIKTHILCSVTFPPENRAVYEIMWKKIFCSQTGHSWTIRRMRVACLIPKATNTHSQYVLLIVFPLQQWLKDRASMLRCTYIACVVIIYLCYAIRIGTPTAAMFSLYIKNTIDRSKNIHPSCISKWTDFILRIAFWLLSSKGANKKVEIFSKRLFGWGEDREICR
jgi:hypothetical protein